MIFEILLASTIIIVCVLLNRFAHKLGIPILLIFIFLGLIFGSDGIFKIHFENYHMAEIICSSALIFIMFYGGFGTNLKQAKPVAVKSALLASVSVVLTAFITGGLAHLILKIPLMESLLIGSIISSTDAASVFSILRSKKLGLKNNTDSMLEIESGSNDPTAYMLTIIILSIMDSGFSISSIVYLLFTQFVFGIVLGVMMGMISSYIMKNFRFETDGFDMAFVTGVALLSYALSSIVGGNGYLSAYLCGIILGNKKLRNKKALVNFFDGLTGLMQMLIFFLLGLLATPSKIPAIFLTSLIIMIFITLIARPIAIFAVLTPFKCNRHQKALVSFAGLRGAASIVFAIMGIVSPPQLENDLYHIVFCIVLLSITFQGTFLPQVARWLKMSDDNIDVLKTFSDYSEEVDLRFIKVRIKANHNWVGKEIKDIILPPDTLVIMILKGEEKIIPNGESILCEGDVVVLSAHKYRDDKAISLQEYQVCIGDEWIGRSIQEFSPQDNELIIMILRGDKTILPKGDTLIKEDDILVFHSE